MIEQSTIDFILATSASFIRNIHVPADEPAFTVRLETELDSSQFIDVIKKVANTYKLKVLCDTEIEQDNGAAISVYIIGVVKDDQKSNPERNVNSQ